MSRVSEQQNQKRTEAERLQKKADKEARTGADAQKSQQFSKMMRQKGGQAAEQQAALAKYAQQDGNGAQQTDAKAKGEQARMRQLARGGTDHSARLMRQAETFQGALSRAGEESAKGNEARTEAKEQSAFEGRTSNEDRVVDNDQRAEAKQDRAAEDAKAESADKAKANAAIDARQGGAGQDSDGGDDEARKDAAHIAPKAQAAAVAKSQSVKKSDAPKIPDEILEKLVSEVWHGITAGGDHEFHIELKDGALAGAKLKVASKNGKVSLAFSGLDQNTQRLFSASEGDLMRRFEAKGLSLEQLSFTS